MISAKLALVLLAAVGAVLGSGKNVSISSSNLGSTYAPGDIMFEDLFNRFDLSVWQHEITMSGGGNWEFQVYSNTRVNSYTRDGILYLFPTLTNDRFGDNFVETGTLSLLGGSPADECTNPAYYGCERTGGGGNIINPVMSARLRTLESFHFRYGKVEVRAKIPAGDWLWPAIWMMPRFNSYGTWPASGEIDIMESRGNRRLFNPQGINIGTEQISHTMHFGPFFPHNGYMNAHYESQSPVDNGYDRDFHVYGVEWTATGITYLLDGAVVGSVNPPAGGFWELGEFPNDLHNPWTQADNPRMAPFDQDFYIILNVAAGGTNGFFPDDVQPPKPWQNNNGNAFADFWASRNAWFPTWVGEDAAMQVDYVRVTAV